jgi:cell division protein FtsZ
MEAIVRDAVTQANVKEEKPKNTEDPLFPNIKKAGTKLGGNTDEELLKIVEGIRASVKVVGCGGAGSNTIDRIVDMGIEGGDVIAVNTDALHLLYNKAPTKILIGGTVSGGIGAGNDPEVGEKCAEADMGRLSEVLTGADLAFVTCGLGGGTGTGSAPVVAEVAKDLGALTIGVVTLPFSVEGKYRARNALIGLKKLRKNADVVIVIPNDKLLELVPNLPLNSAFKVADELLANAVKGITEMVTKPGLVNLDFADLRTTLKNGGTAMIGIGASSKDAPMDERAKESVEKAINSPLLDTDISTSSGALINIIGSSDMTLEEAEQIVGIVAANISPEAQIIWGAQIDDTLERNVVKTLVILSGVKTPQYEITLEEKFEQRGNQELDEQAGLRYI